MMKQDLANICNKVKCLINKYEYDNAMNLIKNSMRDFPDSPVPHNLMGILMEAEGEHVKGMKHFRASYSLDPTFIPTRVNMDLYSYFSRTRACAYTEEDCKEEIKKDRTKTYELIVDEKGIGHLEVVK